MNQSERLIFQHCRSCIGSVQKRCQSFMARTRWQLHARFGTPNKHQDFFEEVVAAFGTDGTFTWPMDANWRAMNFDAAPDFDGRLYWGYRSSKVGLVLGCPSLGVVWISKV